MSVPVHIGDGLGKGLRAHVHRLFSGKREHAGLLTLQERFLQFDPNVILFLNDTFGSAMNQNVSFGGTPELIHDGGDAAGWTGAATSGTWDFADTTNPNDGTNCVSLTSGNNGDEAAFTDGTETNMTNFTAVTGQVRLETYGATTDIVLQFQNNSELVGDSVVLDDFINTGTLNSYQGFVIPKANFGIELQTVDELNMSIVRSGGSKPTFRFDQFQIENTGTPAVFTVLSPDQKSFHITELRFSVADALAGTVTDGTMPGLAYDKLLGLSALSNGIVLASVRAGKTLFSVTLKQLGDFMALGTNMVNAISDGTNTFLTLQVNFPEPIVLKSSESDDFVSLTISDNLSGLLQFTAVARGAVEIER